MLRVAGLALVAVVLAAIPARAAHSSSRTRDVTPIAAGTLHACALLRDGEVNCWGAGYLGNVGSQSQSSIGVVVSGLTDVISLAAGYRSTCALRGDGTVRCWGVNDTGQLGDGTLITRPTPVTVLGLTGVVALSQNRDGYCARLAGGQVKCWGHNAVGQLGDGTTVNRSTPVFVMGLGGVVSLEGGEDHSCASTVTGAVMCWGDNSYRQIGPSFGGPFLVVPTQVPGLSNIKQVGAAWASSCALDAAGVVRCWGLNVFGELGRGFVSGFAGFPTPDLVVGLTHVVALAHGAGRAVCAIRSDDGELWCWGSNAFGQLGIGSVTPAIGTPTRASTVGGNAVFVATSMDDGPELGSGFVCALQGTGAVVCVGWNPFGTLGDGTTTDRSSFVPVILTGPAWNSQDITAGEGTSCATKDNGSVQCWGENPLGQLGVGDTVSRTTPTNVLGLFTSAAALTANSGYGCVLMTDGTAACMGDNWSGALGVGGGPNRTVATDVVGLVTTKNVTGISAGHDSHTCASLSDGTAKCWGSNADGEVGDGSVIDRSTPTTVSNLTGVLQITAGAAHSCALLVGGTIKCWGENDNGQLGDGTTTGRVLPVSVVGLFTSAIAIAAGRYHTCALLVDSTVQCWGANYYGQLGTNSTVGSSSVPVDVHLSNNGLLMNGVALSSGNDHSCAVAADGSLACWGDNYYDQLGDGTQNQRNFAMPISGVTLVSRIAAGWTHSCARRANGTAWCWGMNLYGEIGDGTLTPRPSPIQLGTQFP